MKRERVAGHLQGHSTMIASTTVVRQAILQGSFRNTGPGDGLQLQVGRTLLSPPVQSRRVTQISVRSGVRQVACGSTLRSSWRSASR